MPTTPIKQQPINVVAREASDICVAFLNLAAEMEVQASAVILAQSCSDDHVCIIVAERSESIVVIGCRTRLALRRLKYKIESQPKPRGMKTLSAKPRLTRGFPRTFPRLIDEAWVAASVFANRRLPQRVAELARVPFEDVIIECRRLAAGFATHAWSVQAGSASAFRKTRGMSVGDAESRASDLLSQNPKMPGQSVRSWARAIGCSTGLVAQLTAWRNAKSANRERDTLLRLGS